MDLYLFRHGPAEERDPRRWSDDAKRPLSRSGVAETKSAAQGLAALEPKVERVITSPALRAHRTAELVRDALKVPSPLVTWPELAPDESASGVLARVSREVGQARALILVGHEPTLGEIVGLALAGEATSVARLSRGGVAALEFPRSVAPSAGRLEWLLTRRQLARLGH